MAGLVGGDMNSLDESEHDLSHCIGMSDAWEGGSSFLHGKENQLDNFDEASGHTWGYQSPSSIWAPRRFDKFLYTGALEITPVTESQGATAKVWCLGRGLQTDIPGKEGKVWKAWVSDHFAIATIIKVSA
jgi:hypothetical protein